MNATELLMPAGNLIKLKIAIKNGANAVYFGAQQFNMRQTANNFIYLIMVLLAAITFGQSARLLLNNDYAKSQKKCKKGMLFSLLAYVTAIIR